MKHWVILNLHRIIADASWVFGASLSRLAALDSRRRPDRDGLSRQIAFWRRQLAGDLPTLPLFTDHDRPAVPSFRLASEPVTLTPELVQAVNSLGRQEAVTPFVTFLAAFAVLLHRYTEQDEILVGAPVDDESHQGIEHVVGVLANPLVLCINLSGDPTFRTLLSRVNKVVLDAYANRDVPLLQLIDALQPQRHANQTPLFQVMFALQDALPASVDRSGPTTSFSDIEHGTAQANLTLLMQATGQGDDISGVLSYDTDLFEAATAARMVQHFQVVLGAAATNPTCALSRLPLLADVERQKVFAWSCAPEIDPPNDRCVHHLFEAQAARTPDATAIVQEHQSLCYAALNRRANQVARCLRSHGVKPDQAVGVCLDRSVDMVTALLGVLKAGGAYVALDPAARAEHLAFMVRDAGMSLVIGRREQIRLFTGDTRVIGLDPDSPEIARQSTENLACDTTPDNLAYLIYTSGTTGTPKGVEVTHRGVVRLVRGLDFLPMQPTDVFLQLSSMTFDLSTLEIWYPLVHGARLALFPGRLESFRDLALVLNRERVTCLWLTASLFNAIIDEYPLALSGVRDLLIGGEALSVPHVRRALDLLPSTRLINGYGPTEATTFTHCYTIPRTLDTTLRSIPIGRPIGATEGWILDGRLNPVPIGVPGQLYVGGDGLARGYRNQPALTAKKFIAHPFDRHPDARLYATGDRARFLPDGRVEYLGRTDYQVKIRGFRVELEGIEATLVRQPAVRQALVTCEHNAGEARLVAYVVMNPAEVSRVSELRSFLESKLPDYMVPSQFIVLDALPLSASGKVDRRALPKSDRSMAAAGHSDAPPRTPTEQRLAAIWAELFHIERVAIDDNFFELGGHSLLAARLFIRIEQTLGKRLPLSTLLQSPTLAQLAQAIDEAGRHAPPSALAPIQPGGSNPPLFCVAGIGGSVLGLATLGQSLGDDQPLFGLRLHPSEALAYPTVEARAARYVDEVLAVDPQGPYRLAGYSSGGIIAFEMARQLRARGRAISLLAIFDQAPTEPQPTIPFGTRWLIEFLRNLPYWFTDDFQRSPRGEMIGRLRVKVRMYSAEMRRAFARSGQRTARHDIRDVLGMWRAPDESLRRLEVEYEALTTYVPQVYGGRITLFRARAGPLFHFFPPDMGWTNLAAGGVDVRVVPGSHTTMLAAPYVRVVAEQLKACVAEDARAL